VVDQQGFPSDLRITAIEEQGYIMALEHTTYDVQGVQFHPESILTPDGALILKNWLKK
jgi:anthranilate synthase component 2